MPPTVEFLYWEGCPSHPRALAELRDALERLGLDPDDIHVREVVTDEEAKRSNFRGSPTILVDGRDVDDRSGEPVALACRVYRRRDGRVATTPDPEDVRDALRAALEGAAR